MRWRPVYMYVAFIVFLASAAFILMSLENGSRTLAFLGGIGNLIAGILFVLSVWFPRKKIDWDRIEAEQRLWESGPLGRRWLRVRRRISSRWRL